LAGGETNRAGFGKMQAIGPKANTKWLWRDFFLK
jgi:hypothetical protein